MDKSLSFLYIFVVFGILCAFCSPVSAEKLKIGVVEFEERNPIGVEGAGKVIAELVSENLVNVGIYEVIERVMLFKVLKEQELGMSGVVDSKSAPQIGKLYGLEALVTGSYMKLGDEITVSARLIDTKTGSVISASTVKFKGVDQLQAQTEIMANELSGINREKLKVKKEDIQKSKFKAGIYAGGSYCSDYFSKSTFSLPLGFFINSKIFYFEFFGVGPISAQQISMVIFSPGVNIGRYFGISAGYAMINGDPSVYGDPKSDSSNPYLAEGETKVKGELSCIFIGLRIRPSYKLMINLNIGGNLSAVISKRKGQPAASSGDLWLKYTDTRFLYDFPPSPMGLSVDYFFNEQWGVRAYLIMAHAEGTLSEGTLPAGSNIRQFYSATSVGVAVSFSFSFGNK